MHKSLLILISIFFLTSCIASHKIKRMDGYSVFQNDDKIEKSRYRSTMFNPLETESLFLIPRTFYFNGSTIFHENENMHTYGINVYFTGDDWLFITNDKLLIVCDGEKREFTKPIGTESRNVGYGGSISESVSWSCTKEDLVWIAKAQEVIVRIYSKAGYTDGELKGDGKKGFYKFVYDFVVDTSWESTPYVSKK